MLSKTPRLRGFVLVLYVFSEASPKQNLSIERFCALLAEPFLDLCFFADFISEIVELGSAYFTAPDCFD